MNAREFIETAGVKEVLKALKNMPEGHDFNYTRSEPILGTNNVVIGFDCKSYIISTDSVRKVIGDYMNVVYKNIKFNYSVHVDLVTKLGGIEAIRDKLKTSLLAGERHYLQTISSVNKLFEIQESII